MGTDASTGIKIHRLVDGRASNFSEESPSHKESSSMSLVASRDEAEDDVPYVSSVVAIEDVLPENSDVVAKSRNKAEKLVRCELLVDKGCKDETACQCSTIRRASTTQRARNNGRVRSAEALWFRESRGETGGRIRRERGKGVMTSGQPPP
ncbi:hypothetical protein HPB52_022238 [Rhipicephalus sanguineus]|uniref:Uncharacterized protein n=1 Tax=Rhipicephalus sanguineus TaxID=34632 RepID=A0A9D4YQZ2_RHISA|nr:hypothetical protein HPB52_022238 [Rhipicephalus sanguineus]